MDEKRDFVMVTTLALSLPPLKITMEYRIIMPAQVTISVLTKQGHCHRKESLQTENCEGGINLVIQAPGC